MAKGSKEMGAAVTATQEIPKSRMRPGAMAVLASAVPAERPAAAEVAESAGAAAPLLRAAVATAGAAAERGGTRSPAEPAASAISERRHQSLLPDHDCRFVETELLVVLAGRCAEKLALQGEPGWRRMRSAAELTAWHEAGHGLVAACRGRTVYELSTMPNPWCEVEGRPGYIAGAYCRQGEGLDPHPPKETRVTRFKAEPDERCAVRIAAILAIGTDDPPRLKPSWRAVLRIVREYQRLSSALLATNWILLLKLACELERRRYLDQSDIAAILGPSPKKGTIL